MFVKQMETTTPNIGSTVERTASGYVTGRRGEVIEIDVVGQRARVQWTGRKGNLLSGNADQIIFWPQSSWIKTWVKFTVIKVIS